MPWIRLSDPSSVASSTDLVASPNLFLADDWLNKDYSGMIDGFVRGADVAFKVISWRDTTLKEIRERLVTNGNMMIGVADKEGLSKVVLYRMVAAVEDASAPAPTPAPPSPEDGDVDFAACHEALLQGWTPHNDPTFKIRGGHVVAIPGVDPRTITSTVGQLSGASPRGEIRSHGLPLSSLSSYRIYYHRDDLVVWTPPPAATPEEPPSSDVGNSPQTLNILFTETQKEAMAMGWHYTTLANFEVAPGHVLTRPWISPCSITKESRLVGSNASGVIIKSGPPRPLSRYRHHYNIDRLVAWIPPVKADTSKSSTSEMRAEVMSQGWYLFTSGHTKVQKGDIVATPSVDPRTITEFSVFDDSRGFMVTSSHGQTIKWVRNERGDASLVAWRLLRKAEKPTWQWISKDDPDVVIKVGDVIVNGNKVVMPDIAVSIPSVSSKDAISFSQGKGWCFIAGGPADINHWGVDKTKLSTLRESTQQPAAHVFRLVGTVPPKEKAAPFRLDWDCIGDINGIAGPSSTPINHGDIIVHVGVSLNEVSNKSISSFTIGDAKGILIHIDYDNGVWIGKPLSDFLKHTGQTTARLWRKDTGGLSIPIYDTVSIHTSYGTLPVGLIWSHPPKPELTGNIEFARVLPLP